MRQNDWQVRLARWAREMNGQPYIWGQTDCHALIPLAYEQMYGVKLRAPAWKTKFSGLRLLVQGGDLPAILEGLGAVEVRRPVRGDICLEPIHEGGVNGVSIKITPRLFLTSHIEHGVFYQPDVHPASRYFRWIDG